jgi:hypothetical protein
MLFINKKTKYVKAINSIEESILLGEQNYSEYDQKRLLQKLELYKADYWIKCNCAQNALLVICALNGNIYIRCKHIETHHKNCTYTKNDIIIGKNVFKASAFKPIKKYNLYKNIIDLSKESSQHNINQSTTRSLSKLGQVLYTIFVDSRVNIINCNNPLSTLEELTRITDAFQDEEKLIARNIPLKKCYRYALNDTTIEQAKNFLVRAKTWFPDSLKPFVLFSSVATSISNHQFILKKGSKRCISQNIITTTSTWINKDKSAPYFILTAAILENETFVLKDTFALPIVSNSCLMPVESNYERTVFKILIKYCKLFPGITIEKPLFDTITENKEKFRPDFIIHLKNSRKIYIEVLGSSNPHYLNHKNNIADIAINYCCAYISIKAFDLQNEYDFFVKKLHLLLKQYN